MHADLATAPIDHCCMLMNSPIIAAPNLMGPSDTSTDESTTGRGHLCLTNIGLRDLEVASSHNHQSDTSAHALIDHHLMCSVIAGIVSTQALPNWHSTLTLQCGGTVSNDNFMASTAMAELQDESGTMRIPHGYILESHGIDTL